MTPTRRTFLTGAAAATAALGANTLAGAPFARRRPSSGFIDRDGFDPWLEAAERTGRSVYDILMHLSPALPKHLRPRRSRLHGGSGSGSGEG